MLIVLEFCRRCQPASCSFSGPGSGKNVWAGGGGGERCWLLAILRLLSCELVALVVMRLSTCPWWRSYWHWWLLREGGHPPLATLPLVRCPHPSRWSHTTSRRAILTGFRVIDVKNKKGQTCWEGGRTRALEGTGGTGGTGKWRWANRCYPCIFPKIILFKK